MEQVSDKAVLFLQWNTIEAEAQKQILNTATMPFVFKHVAVMPDCHYGKGATIGTVLPTDGAVIPAAVGVDIGCGMIAVRTPLKRADIPDAAKGRYSRTKARSLFSMDDLRKAMDGIEFRGSKVLLDEIPGAYKDIDQVMEHAKDLVEVKYVLKQFINVKGD